MSDIEQKIRALLGQGSEHEKLDYKQSLDLDDKAEVIEITKDIAAMLSSGGGSLLIGADDTGGFGTRFTDELYEKFDETTLRSKLKKYIDEPFDVHVSSVKVEDHNFVLIECGGYENGFVVLKSDGQYVKNGKTKLIFRTSEVFVRHGSASERWQQHDIRRIIASQVSKERAEWIKELRTINPNSIDNERHLKAGLKKEIGEVRSKISTSMLTQPDIEVSLDRITKVAIEAVDNEDDVVFTQALKTMHDIYNLGFNSEGRWHLDNGFNPVELWHEILIRIPLIGGACVEAKRYDLAKTTALQSVDGEDGEYYSNWYRHALTMSARASYSPRSSTGEPHSILSATTSLFREDTLYKQLLNWGDDDGRMYIVRFDYLAAIVIEDDLQENDKSNYYPSFAFYRKANIMPMMRDILLNEQTRFSLFKSKSPQLAYIINSIDELAERESGHFWRRGQWRGDELNAFMQKAQPFNT